ncbi:flagellar protein export ATPase FliI [Neobacillus rhizophilus]|uniref:Flagellar protein export ATPase FliI n=1 Tax=Neobacillus rhizophilus TaxID=2833579 RepID=A0A942U5X6_9BACI|nr:flagellar protein export ATPase FliI [Neobacillus rhizophilus]MBU8918263.1 flagellar protein export ATPase FliI [Bacillus sp. FJAT-29953]
MNKLLKIEKYLQTLQTINPIKFNGKVTQVIGLTIESQGPDVKLGDVCLIYPSSAEKPLEAEVVGFKGNRVLLMPLGELVSIGPGCEVVSTGKPLTVKVGMELLGKVLDGLGKPMDESPLPSGLVEVDTNNNPPNPLKRPRIHTPLSVGVRAIDGLLTIGKGQRVGIFAGSGVGKSTLLGMIARNTSADVNVIGLIGERGREVLDFIERDLGKEGLEKSVVVVATSDQPALVRIKGAIIATTIAEFFRDQGLSVNLMLDSVTRYAMAQREIGLAIGEPPTTKGYTPSVFAMLPKLLERAGTGPRGEITAFYTVLVDGDDMNEPIADTTRGILDGHIVLDRKLAQQGHFPSINVLNSISRVMKDIGDAEHLRSAEILKQHMAIYKEAEDLIKIGAYKQGTNAEIDLSIKYKVWIDGFLKQGVNETSHLDDAVAAMIQQFGGMAK